MTTLRGKIASFTVDYATGKQIVTLEVSTDFRPYYDDLKEKDLSIELKQYKKKRSLDANAFLWATLGDIGAKLRIPPREVYRELIPDVGGNYTIYPVKKEAVAEYMEMWNGIGVGWICESLGDSKLKGYENLRCYRGSSSYDTVQMSRLIDLALAEAKDLGIQPRLTAQERAAALELWRNDEIRASKIEKMSGMRNNAGA